jgi:hypothetical protein
LATKEDLVSKRGRDSVMKNVISMKLSYINEKRHRIIPKLRSYVHPAVRHIQYYMAAHGKPISDNDRKLLALKGKHQGQRCFIIGNGPSLRIIDLDALKNEITFAANKIFLAFQFTDWRPTYYNVEDYLDIQEYHQVINSLSGFIKLLRWWPDKLLLKGEDTIFYDMYDLPNSKYPDFSTSPLKGVFCGFSVTYSSLQFAYFMGCKEIYFIGVDFSYKLPDVVDKKSKVIDQGEANYFLPNYRKKGDVWFEPKLDLQEKSLAYAKDFCKDRGVKIYNATRGGKLEVFPRVDFESLF